MTPHREHNIIKLVCWGILFLAAAYIALQCWVGAYGALSVR